MKKYFNHPRQVVQTVYDEISIEELRELFAKYRPTEVYLPIWSEKNPCLTITDYTEDGFLGQWNWNTPEENKVERLTVDKLYNILRFSGFNLCYINIPDEPEGFNVTGLIQEYRGVNEEGPPDTFCQPSAIFSNTEDLLKKWNVHYGKEPKETPDKPHEQPKYNPAFIKGEPKEAGWYIAAVKGIDTEDTFEVQLWFMPEDKRLPHQAKWWREIQHGYSQQFILSENVVAYTPIPKYKL